MATELAFVLMNPSTITKSQTGGVIARLIGRTGLNITASRMYGPSQDLADKTAGVIRSSSDDQGAESEALAAYVETQYGPKDDGSRRRVMLLLFEGDDAIAKISGAVHAGPGSTVRRTFGENSPNHFEPAVIAGASKSETEAMLTLWASHAVSDGGIITDMCGLDKPGNEATLLMIKPENFRAASLRPGAIIDLMSSSDLTIVGMQLFHMKVSQALEFYGPVRDVLRDKLQGVTANITSEAMSEVMHGELTDDLKARVGAVLGPAYGDVMFEDIIEFMTGFRPSDLSEDELDQSETTCLAMVYIGPDAISTVRSLLGPTDSAKAGPGTIRFEFGTDIMVNAAHASDSVDNAKREVGIIGVADDTISPLVKKYTS